MKYIAEYTTDFCDSFPDDHDFVEVEAENDTEAYKKIKEAAPYHSAIEEIRKVD